MGNYSKNISERIRNVRITEGYCLICGNYGELTMDHVPPKGAITISKVEQKHIFDLVKGDNKKIKGVISQNGSKFKTICVTCNNNVIGENDMEVSSVIKALNIKIKNHFNNPRSIYNSVLVPFNSVRFCRAMIGHILSATTVNHCKTPPVNAPYFRPLQDFVLGDDDAIKNTHDIYYWFYPQRMHISSKMVYFRNHNSDCMLSILSFFPIAFLVTDKDKGIYPPQSTKLTLQDTRLVMDLSAINIKYSNFPFIEFENEEILLTNSDMCIVSYPIK